MVRIELIEEAIDKAERDIRFAHALSINLRDDEVAKALSRVASLICGVQGYLMAKRQDQSDQEFEAQIDDATVLRSLPKPA